MKRTLQMIGLSGLAMMAGCASTGLSPRENATHNQSLYLYSLYTQPNQDEAPEAGPKRLATPARLAVVMVGEAAPPDAMLSELRSRKDLFSVIQPMPDAVDPTAASEYRGSAATEAAQSEAGRQARNHLTAMRKLAADSGMDYLLLTGGTMDDFGNSATPLSVLDLTLVGAFIVPSQQSRVTATATGALIDVQTGRLLMQSSAQADKNQIAPSASVDNEKLKLKEKVRDQVSQKLAKQFIEDCLNRSRVSSTVAAPSQTIK